MPAYRVAASVFGFHNMGYGDNGCPGNTFTISTTHVSTPHFPDLYLGRVAHKPMTTPIQNDVSELSTSGGVDLAALIAGVGAIVASLSVTRMLATAVVGVGAVVPNLKAQRTLSTTVAGTSTVGPGLSVTRRLATVIAGTSAISADLTTTVGGVTRLLATAIAGTSTVQGALFVSRRLTTAIAGSSTVSVLQLTRSARLTVLVAGTSAVQGALRLVSAFAARVSGSSSVLPNLTIIGGAPIVTITKALLRRRRALRESGSSQPRKRRPW
jgi:hypothetical protein